jgi:uncharacterized membrane protein YdbT with pleckstrin-like domain
MSYVQQVLQPEETVRFHTTVHWSIFLSAIISVLIGLAFVVWHYMDQKANLLLLIGAMVFGVTGVVLAVAAWLKRFGTEVAVTDRRVIYKRGLIQRHTVEMNLDKVESVDVDQSLVARLLGYGTVTIRGTGQAIEPIRDMADPLRFRGAILAR